jgi:hypothetical protein
MWLEGELSAVPSFYVTLCEPIIEIAGISGIRSDGCWSNFRFSIIPLLVPPHAVISIYIAYILVYIVHYVGCETFVILLPKNLFPPALFLCC